MLRTAALLLCSAAAQGGKAPSGSYCGSVAGAADLRLTIVDATHFNVVANVFGTNTTCMQEAYSFNSANGTMTLPDFSKPTDCLNKEVGSYGVSGLDITYDAKTDVISVDAQLAVVTLKHCGKHARGRSRK